MATLEERLAKAEERVKQLKAEQQKLEARKKAEAQKRSRNEVNRRRFLVGATVLAKLEDGSFPEEQFIQMMNEALSKTEDRKLFGLAEEEDSKTKG